MPKSVPLNIILLFACYGSELFTKMAQLPQACTFGFMHTCEAKSGLRGLCPLPPGSL